MALLVSLAGAACGGADEADRPQASTAAPTPVAVGRAAMTDAPAVFDAGGVVRARHAAVMASRVLAPISTVRVRPGDDVRAGQRLIELDARQLDADARRAAAAVAAAENGARAADADVPGAEAALALARATHERIAWLFERRSATAQERDDAEAALRAAEARVNGARARAKEAAAAVEAARAAAEAAAIAASYAALTAPFDGRVSERRTDPGDMAVPGQPLLTIEDTSVLELEVRLDEARAGAVDLGQTVPVHFDAASAGDSPIDGRVVEIGRLDPVSHSFVVKLQLPASPSLRPGVFGRAAFPGPTRSALAVPADAVVRRGQLIFVFSVHEGRARLRPISVGQERRDGIEVTAGIADGDLVVLSPPESLVDGAELSVVSRGALR